MREKSPLNFHQLQHVSLTTLVAQLTAARSHNTGEGFSSDNMLCCTPPSLPESQVGFVSKKPNSKGTTLHSKHSGQTYCQVHLSNRLIFLVITVMRGDTWS